MQAQLQALVGKRFIVDNDYAQLAHFPRYLKAINVRLEKLRADPPRDARLMAEWQQAAAPWQRAQKDRRRRASQRSEDGRIPLAAGRAAGVAVRAGIAHADAGVGQAPAEGVGIDAALASRQAEPQKLTGLGGAHIFQSPVQEKAAIASLHALRPKGHYPKTLRQKD